MTRVSIGLRSKTARAIGVVLGGTIESPEILMRVDLPLTDPQVAHTDQPYHAVMHLPWADAEVAVLTAATAIQRIATQTIDRWVSEISAGGHTICGVGLVGTAERDLSKIGNYHIRAHAAEGILFCKVLEVAAKARELPCRTFPEKGLYERASSELGRPSKDLHLAVSEMGGRGVIRPWRADEKLAALAAWTALGASSSLRRGTVRSDRTQT